jgi:hypothetical protein
MFVLIACRLRAKLNKAQEASGGKKISLNDFVIKVSHVFIPMGFAASSKGLYGDVCIGTTMKLHLPRSL